MVFLSSIALASEERCLKEKDRVDKESKRVENLETRINIFFAILGRRKFSTNPKINLKRIVSEIPNQFGSPTIVTEVVKDDIASICNLTFYDKKSLEAANVDCEGDQQYHLFREKHHDIDQAAVPLTESEQFEFKIIDWLSLLNWEEKGRRFCLSKINDIKQGMTGSLSLNEVHNVLNAELSLSDTEKQTCDISLLEPSQGDTKYSEIEFQCESKVYRLSNINSIRTNEVDPNEYQNIANWVRRAFGQWSKLRNGKDYKLKRLASIKQLVQTGIVYVIRSEVSSPADNLRKNCTVLYSRELSVSGNALARNFLIKCGIESALITMGHDKKQIFKQPSYDELEKIVEAVLAKVKEEMNVEYRFYRIVPRSGYKQRANGEKYFVKAKVITPDSDIKVCDVEIWEQQLNEVYVHAALKCEGKIYNIYS